METIIVSLIVLAAAVYLIVVFCKRAKGQNGCQCQGKCGGCKSTLCDDLNKNKKF